jgi:hypothetical protein
MLDIIIIIFLFLSVRFFVLSLFKKTLGFKYL